MKLASINHPELEIIDEGLREKLLAAALGAGVTAGGLIGGQALMKGGGGEKDAGANKPVASQKMSKSEQSFWNTGTTQEPDGTIVTQELGQSRQEALSRGLNAMAQFMGVNRLPSGLEESIEEMDGIYKATITYSKDNAAHAAEAGQQTRDSQIIQDPGEL